MKLYFDDARCTGYTQTQLFKFEASDSAFKCSKADVCERYLQREVNIGPRTGLFNAETAQGCSMFLERSTGLKQASKDE